MVNFETYLCPNIAILFYFFFWNIYINIFPYIFPYKYKYKIFRNFM